MSLVFNFPNSTKALLRPILHQLNLAGVALATKQIAVVSE